MQTEHDIEYKGAILGTFYGKWYIYINVPLITSNYIIKSILKIKKYYILLLHCPYF